MNTDSANSAPLRDQRLGDIARTLAGATAVLRRYRLDFCCGGDVTLRDAALRRDIDVDAVEAELGALDPGAPPALPAAAGDLVAHIVTRFHDVHRAELPELITLAAKVERVHREHPAAPLGLADALQRMRDEHDEHGEALSGLFALTDELALPDDACNTWRALYLGLRKFTDDLTEHIHTENNILFPRFESGAAR